MTRTILGQIFACNSALMLFWGIMVRMCGRSRSFYLPFITLTCANNIYYDFSHPPNKAQVHIITLSQLYCK